MRGISGINLTKMNFLTLPKSILFMIVFKLDIYRSSADYEGQNRTLFIRSYGINEPGEVEKAIRKQATNHQRNGFIYYIILLNYEYLGFKYFFLVNLGKHLKSLGEYP